MKKIGVYYIVTGKYKDLFPEFLESLQNFFPDVPKSLKLISDGLEEYKDYELGNIKVDLCPRINHYPWPIVTLYKMYHILENRDDTCDFVCYFNGNAAINIHDDNIFDLSKLNVSYHSFNGKNNPYDPWPYINVNPDSSAYIENGTYDYFQAAFFFGPSNIVFKMCEDVGELLKYDISRCIFAQWHDESYFNKWCYLNKPLINKDYYLTVYKDDLDKKRFIYLRDKSEYKIFKV